MTARQFDAEYFETMRAMREGRWQLRVQASLTPQAWPEREAQPERLSSEELHALGVQVPN